MEFRALSLKDLILITPDVFGDSRGFFLESYNKETFTKAGLPVEFVQDNHSKSDQNVLRGLHFQRPPYTQGKLVRCIKGSIRDIVVDLRKSSPTYLKWEAVVLDDKSMQFLYVPEGFAHGFVTLEPCEVQYKCTNVYHKASEGGIRWSDPSLGLPWGIKEPIVSEKDQLLPTLNSQIDALPF
ncbi:MAG: dTDP-4-dehydrorhamnose 3,5-epimerase [Cytophagaceae bacterium]|jgi:dTDP-4-dehydrorhamnose 3,5-epimerase|nr:dTDP-4-dehydrorhamnose 3,5-epimerase [Cytophagaceae bacterium]